MYLDNYSKWFSEQLQEGNADDNTADELPVEVYKLMVGIAIKKGELKHAAWLVWQWTLCSRSHNITNLRCHHFKCLGDYVKVQHDRVKTGGHEVTSPKHCYQNPYMAVACCDFVLGLYLCSTRDRPQEDDPRIFVGADTAHSTFNKWFVDLVKEHEGEISQIASGKNLSSHSVRKGSGTAGANGTTAAPSVISICRRGDWSIGQVLDRYLKWAAAQDQYLGRVLALLPSYDGRFATPAAHWVAGSAEAVNAGIEEVFGANYPLTFRPMLKRCLAAMVNHSKWVLSELPPTHCVRCNPLYVGGSADGTLLAELSKLVTLDQPENASPTGIPPYIFNLQAHEKTIQQLKDLAAEQQQTNQHLRDLSATLVQDMRAFLEDRAVEAGVITIDGMQGRLDTQQTKLEAAIAKKMDEQHNAIKELLAAGGPLTPPMETSSATTTEGPAADSIAPTESGGHKLFFTSAGAQYVPAEWKFPRVSLRDGWRMWLKGMPSIEVRPFRVFSITKYVPRKQVNALYEWQLVFRKFESFASVDITEPVAQSFDAALSELKMIASYCWAKKGDCSKWAVSSWAKALRPGVIKKRGTPEDIEKLGPETFRNKKRHRAVDFYDAQEA